MLFLHATHPKKRVIFSFLFHFLPPNTKNMSTIKKQPSSPPTASQFPATLMIAALFFAVLTAPVAGEHESTIFEVSAAQEIVKNSCSSTLYPDFCYSTLATTPELTKKVKNHKNVIELSLNITIETIKHNRATFQKILDTNKNLTKREITALHDCLETSEDSLDELHDACVDLEHYPNPSRKSLKKYADDLNTLMSTAMTDQQTCLEGFTYNQEDKEIRKPLIGEEIHVEKLCSNALAMIVNMTVKDMEEEERNYSIGGGRKLKAAKEVGGWPEWLSGGDRRLLQSSTVKADVVVAADGSGNFKTVAEAVAAAPEKSSKRYVIRIKAGTYRENVEVPKKKKNIMFLGDGQSNTIITGSRNVVDGSTTFHSATVAVVGERFLARDITFQNTAGPSKHQAVALRVGSDLSAFYRCNILAYQDTLYLHSNRQFFINCLIAGTVDFIFGNAAAVIQNSEIRPLKPNPGQKNMITAQSRLDPNQNTGFVIQKCKIEADLNLKPVQKSLPTFLGRPWKQYSRVVVMQSTISDVVDPAGWHEWDGNFGLDTLFYGEYQNTGAGAGTTGRVK